MKQKKGIPVILVVEDDESTLRMMYYFLREDYEPKFADRISEAREILKSEPVEMILLDLSLKGKGDGLDLVRELRKSKKWKKIPIIATTAHVFTTDKERCMEAGCNDFLPKPISRTQMLNTIEKWL
ncbi:MAG: response regulator [Fidelibacterota bacterium]